MSTLDSLGNINCKICNKCKNDKTLKDIYFIETNIIECLEQKKI
jgi:hypothetical protein